MADRRKQIILLIGSRFDYSFEPETFTGKVVRRGATAGKGSPSHWQDCASCDGGSKRDRFGRLQECLKCGGKGQVRVDDYTEEVVVTEASDKTLGALIERDTQLVGCPDCQGLVTEKDHDHGGMGQGRGIEGGRLRGPACRRCDGTGWAAVPGSWLSEPSEPRTGGDALDAMLDAIERRNLFGSYKELDAALAGIAHHANKPLRFTALTLHAGITLTMLDKLYVTRLVTEDELTEFERSLLELALAYVDSRMPAEIRVPPQVIANAKRRESFVRPKGQALTKLQRERRDRDIRKWDKEGKSRVWIAQRTGLSQSSLREIINAKRERAA